MLHPEPLLLPDDKVFFPFWRYLTYETNGHGYTVRMKTPPGMAPTPDIPADDHPSNLIGRGGSRKEARHDLFDQLVEWLETSSLPNSVKGRIPLWALEYLAKMPVRNRVRFSFGVATSATTTFTFSTASTASAVTTMTLRFAGWTAKGKAHGVLSFNGMLVQACSHRRIPADEPLLARGKPTRLPKCRTCERCLKQAGFRVGQKSYRGTQHRSAARSVGP